MNDDQRSDSPIENTPGQGRTPEPERIEPAAPEEFGLVQVWWGDGKGKTTATLGMGLRAAGHGYRVHMLQFMKGGASSVDAVRGEYNAMAMLPGLSYENLGHYGWHGMADGSDEADHEAEAQEPGSSALANCSKRRERPTSTSRSTSTRSRKRASTCSSSTKSSTPRIAACSPRRTFTTSSTRSRTASSSCYQAATPSRRT